MTDKAETEAAERALIGAWVHDGLRVGGLLQRLKVRPEWWRGDPTRRALAETLLAMTEQNHEIDELTVMDRMRREKDGDPAVARAAAEEIERCVDACPSSLHAEHYAQMLRREHMAAAIRRAFSHLSASLDNTEPETVAAEASEMMRAVLEDHEVFVDLDVRKLLLEQVQKWRQAADDRRTGKVPDLGVPLPWWRLTKIIGGLPNDLVVLAARPSVGKTALEGLIRTHAAKEGYNTLSMLLDMSAERVLPRDMVRLGGVSMAKLNFGFARHDQLDAMEAAAHKVADLNMRFVRSTRLEVLAMRARHLKAKGKLDLLSLDHCQLAGYAGSDRHDMRQRVTRVTADTKALAQELGVPFLLLSQLRRCEPGMQEREPELDDLRDSGTLEQDATVVLFMHRNMQQVKKWQKEGDQEAIEDKKRPIDLLLKKNQNGALGKIRLIMRTRYFTFELADQDYNPLRDDDPTRDAERE